MHALLFGSTLSVPMIFCLEGHAREWCGHSETWASEPPVLSISLDVAEGLPPKRVPRLRRAVHIEYLQEVGKNAQKVRVRHGGSNNPAERS